MPAELRNVTYIYQKNSVFERRALSEISLAVNDGEFLGIIGRTGSGKSTLIQHLNGLLKPESGAVYIGGEDISADKKKLKEARRKVGLVFQYPEHQLFEATVFDDVAFGPKNLGCREEEVKERVEWALGAVGIAEELYTESPFDLSGGQKRRVAIAGVLAMRPEILILDEPAAGLDPAGRDEILTRIRDLRDRLGLTVILVSHSMDDVARLCERVIVLDDGKIVTQGTPADVFARAEELKALGLGVPESAEAVLMLNAAGLAAKPAYTPQAAAEAIYEALAAHNSL